MNWKDIAGPLINAGATALGTLVGGPAGAAIGAGVGPILADALGVPATPEAVGAAIGANPDAVSQIEKDRGPDLRAAIEQATTDHIRAINETMRAELASESWAARMWRPLFGLCFALVWTLHGLAIGWALYLRQYDIVARIPDLTIFYSVAGAVVGVYAWRRTDEKLAGVTGGISRIVEAAAAAIKPKGAKP